MSVTTTTLDDPQQADLNTWDPATFLKKVTDIVPNVIYVFNQHTQSNEYSNRSLGTSLGYTAMEISEMGADLMPRLCHPEDLWRVHAHFGKLQKLNDGEVATIEYRMCHKDGTWVWLLSNDTVFDRAIDGSNLRHIGVASDITAQKKAEANAIDEAIRASTINDELRAFSYAMSHDMKAPSNSLNLLLNELLDTHKATLDADAMELLDMALATVSRMGSLVDDVLDYTRVIGQDYEVATVSMQSLVTDIVSDLRASIKRTNAKITVSELPDVIADRMQMRVLFQNLIENAIKFHKRGETPHVVIYATDQPDTKTALITVKDSGIGIAPAKHEQIFTVFKRLNATTEYSGSGLGLAICRRIAANHGNKITLDSEVGQGSAFTIGLKRA